jgi:ABC-2 type transport system ATP-binding protein
MTIILTTHYMEEADFLCGRVAIMDHGKFVALDTPVRLKDTLGGDVVSLELEGAAAAFLDALGRQDWIKRSKFHEDVLMLTMEKGERRIPELVMLAQQMGVTVNCVHLRKPSLEDVFLHFTGRTIREQEANLSERNRAMMMAHGRR